MFNALVVEKNDEGKTSASVQEIGEDRLTVVRPTYIVGPGDHTDRFSYWPIRASKGGDMLWPGSPEQLFLLRPQDPI